MADAPPPDSDDGPTRFTLDLSTGKAPRRRKRKGPAPVVQKTINLSTPKPAADPPAEAPTPSSGRKRDRTRDGGRNGRPRSGNSLADLLDPETLARLRGEG